MQAVILAAGEGTRLNKSWTVVPKPLLEVNGKSIIEHVIFNLKEAGIKEIIIVTGFMSEHIKDHLRDGAEKGVNIKYVYNADYKQDFTSSLIKVKPHITGPFILCMADLFFNSSVIINLLSNASEKSNYVCVDTKLSKARRIEEKVKIQTSQDKVFQASLVLPVYNAVDCAIYFLQESVFETIQKCMDEDKRSFPLVMTELAIQNQFKVCDIGDEEVVDIDREKDVEYVLKNVKK